MAPCIAKSATVVTPISSAYGCSRPRKLPANSPRASSGTPQAMLPIATPISRLEHEAAAPRSRRPRTRRQRGDGCLLRNSIATARKISAQSRAMNAR